MLGCSKEGVLCSGGIKCCCGSGSPALVVAACVQGALHGLKSSCNDWLSQRGGGFLHRGRMNADAPKPSGNGRVTNSVRKRHDSVTPLDSRRADKSPHRPPRREFGKTSVNAQWSIAGCTSTFRTSEMLLANVRWQAGSSDRCHARLNGPAPRTRTCLAPPPVYVTAAPQGVWL